MKANGGSKSEGEDSGSSDSDNRTTGKRNREIETGYTGYRRPSNLGISRDGTEEYEIQYDGTTDEEDEQEEELIREYGENGIYWSDIEEIKERCREYIQANPRHSSACGLTPEPNPNLTNTQT